MPTLQVSRLESLIADKISSLGYVSRVGYSDDGQEVAILVIHDDDPERDRAMVLELTRRGIGTEREIPDRMISPLAIQGGPDLPGAYLRDARRPMRGRRGEGQETEWFRKQGERNRRVYGLLNADHVGLEDWKVAAVPCSALRGVNHRFDARTGRVPKNHAGRSRRVEGELPTALGYCKTPSLLGTRARYCEGLGLGDARRRMAVEMPGRTEKEIPFS